MCLLAIIDKPNSRACVIAGFEGFSIPAFHSVLLLTDGSVWTTGRNAFGQLGVGSTTTKTTFQRVIDSDAVSVGAGQFQTYVVMRDGSLLVAGKNSNGELGKDPKKANILTFEKTIASGVKEATGGDAHSLVLKQDGSVWGAGLNNQGQLGADTEDLKGQFNLSMCYKNGIGT